MNDITLGQIVKHHQGRDAVHIAIVGLLANEQLFPGQDVGIMPDPLYAGLSDDPIGIVDPFLTHPVLAGQRFWLMLYPNTITSLQHNWTHPAFEHAESGQDYCGRSAQWLREFAGQADLDYDLLIEIVSDFINNNEVWVQQDSESARTAFGMLDKNEKKDFWNHAKNVTGLQVDDDYRSEPFSCSC